jgi:hypothetical protein
MTGPTVHLDGPSIEAIAVRLAELLRGEAPADELLDAAEVARRFRVSRDWVYEHSEQLGAIRLGRTGEGRRPRLRFNAARVAEVLAADPAPEPDRPKRRPRRGPAAEVELLPIRTRGNRT